MNENIRKIEKIIDSGKLKNEILNLIIMFVPLIIFTIMLCSIYRQGLNKNMPIMEAIFHSFLGAIVCWMSYLYSILGIIEKNSNEYKRKVINERKFEKIYYLLKSINHIIVTNKLIELKKYMEDYHNPITYGYMEIFIDDIKNKIIAQDKEK